VGSNANVKPENEDCGKDAGTSLCFMGQFKINMNVKCHDGSTFSIVYNMGRGKSSGESSILVMGMGAKGTHWKHRTPQLIADAAGYMAHLFQCRDDHVLWRG
jgi:hypothetical protein